MAAPTITTNNPHGLGYRTGQFTPNGAVINQTWFDAAFAGRISGDKVYREAYHCNVCKYMGMTTWLEEYMGYDTECHTKYTLLETYGSQDFIKVNADTTVPAAPGTVAIPINTATTYVGIKYVLPQVGDTIVLTKTGELATVTAVTITPGTSATVTVKLRNASAPAQDLLAGDELLVLAGSELQDCACPTPNLRVPDLPLERDLQMIDIGQKAELCGDALLACQKLKIPFYNEDGTVSEKWWTPALSQMYSDHEKRKHYEVLLNPNFGVIPTIKARGIKLTPAATTEITEDDLRGWKLLMDAAGICTREYAVFCGREIYSQFQRLLMKLGALIGATVVNPLDSCKWLNLEYCGIKIEGLTLHIYEEPSFSNGKELGGQSMVFPKSAIFVPLGETTPVTRSNGRVDQVMPRALTMTYFRDNTGRVWDNVTDANGLLAGRNSFGTGCTTQEWSIRSKFLAEVHCPTNWLYIGLS